MQTFISNYKNNQNFETKVDSTLQNTLENIQEEN